MYKLPPLPYSFEELEPFINTHTLGLHYHKHEQNYLDKLNGLLKKNRYDYRYSLSELLYHINEFPQEDRQDILYNLGGVLNHNLYWKSMNSSPKRPIGKLENAINLKYGGFDEFMMEFKNAAMRLKGSGYTFLIVTKNNQLEIVNVSNQDTPLFNQDIPLFNVDMWEHAYYLNYKNEKEKYLDNFFEIADFSNASQIYDNLVN